MLDFLLGGLLVGAVWFLVSHFGASTGIPKAKIIPTLETLLSGIKNLMTTLVQDLLAQIEALPGKIDAAAQAEIANLKAQLAAEQQAHAADLQAVQDKLNAVTPPDPAPASAPADPAAQPTG